MLRIFVRKNLWANFPAVGAFHTSAVDTAARKGTREKAKKKKVKVEVKKVGFIPHNQRKKDNIVANVVNKHVDDSWKQTPHDDVYVGKYYKWKVYSFREAVESHRETHHPTMYNIPNANLDVHIELNMVAEKKTRYIENFHRIAKIEHSFDLGVDRKILVFTKAKEIAQEALAAGASHAGGAELIRDVQNGEVLLSDYHYVLAHPEILPELVTLRGLMKKKFPNPKSGSLGADIPAMVHHFKNGVEYSAVRDENQLDFGLVTTTIGTLNMDIEHLEKNLISILEDLDSVRPKRDGKFISRVLLKSAPSAEQFKIDPFLYVDEVLEKYATKVDAEAEEKKEEAQAVQ
ncbi:39S ribosomal protein L1, mitochondrial [Lutzomyia longipalpis]|uniref:39S ribosomal protein L1, mitochondrial n=1 Tax=Lutzomyia longipalpis TaxID=7200 RepID=UPI002483D1DD|nr:39S ribosomal protein L1, mitochondrial [Lutzomyia longipalpis]